MTDPTGMGPWEPDVENNRLVVKKEEGDNARTLAKFLNVKIETAQKLYEGMSSNGVIQLPDNIPGVSAINAAIDDYIKGNTLYSSFSFGGFIENYNCWESAISIAYGISPDFQNTMERFEFGKEIKSNFVDVTDSPSKLKFGHTLTRFAKTRYSLLHGNYSETTHAATYLGTSNNGTQYFWSKNGRSAKPGIFSLETLQNKYGHIEGYRAKLGGGYYNVR